MRSVLTALSLSLLPALVQAQTTNICGLLSRNPGWHDTLKTTHEKWRVTPGVLLAVLDQESRFNAYARGAGADRKSVV